MLKPKARDKRGRN
ncbi:hypothetical protein IEO21_11176 [Rhodonia placenta]|uniref:Uncharacterized protein n=1 Tax=Rhodonia placenta TaxID=104341 RepID=A0A8H7NQX3_9APHY|nr:hypothetical protein IEO21_11176 [Postia placenta]